MAKPSDKITITMTRSEWNLYIAKMIHSDMKVRHSAAIKFTTGNGLD